jgi:phosphoribosylformylglycinamidine synthase
LAAVDLEEQARTLSAVRALIRTGLVEAAHDVSEGGLAVALAEMTIPARIGVQARISGDGTAWPLGEDFESAWFGEGPGGVVIACRPESFEEFAAICGDVPLVRLGETGGSRLLLEGRVATLALQVDEAATAYEEAIPSSFA